MPDTDPQIEEFLAEPPADSEQAADVEVSDETPPESEQAVQPESTETQTDAEPEEKPVEEQPKEDKPAEPQAPVDLQKAEAELLERFERMFPISEEDVLVLRSEPEKILPRFAAAATYASVRQAIAYVVNNLPSMIDEVMTQKATRTEAEDTFWKSNPVLDRAKHRQDLIHFGKAYRDANPTVSMEQFIKEVGIMVAAKNNLLAAAAPKPAPVPVPAPAPAPVGTSAQGSAPVVRQKPKKTVDPSVAAFFASLEP